MPHPLDEKYPTVRHFLATNLFGDDSFEHEVDGFVHGAGSRDVVLQRISDMRRLLADSEVSDDELDSFVLAHANWFVDQSGRRTIETVADRLQWALDNPPPPDPLTRRAPALVRLLEEHTRSRGDLDALVRAGAVALGPEAAEAAAAETSALLTDPSLSDQQLSAFVRSHSWWLVDDSGRRTLERVAAALRSGRSSSAEGSGMSRHDARAHAERLLDEMVRPSVEDAVIVDEHTRESDDAWVFIYNSRAYLETGSFRDMIVGNAPILVDKATGQTRFEPADTPVDEQR
jgi:hypothetical protein